MEYENFDKTDAENANNRHEGRDRPDALDNKNSIITTNESSNYTGIISTFNIQPSTFTSVMICNFYPNTTKHEQNTMPDRLRERDECDMT